jgi:CRISPR/Cas system-associated endoribonuclease Cas2
MAISAQGMIGSSYDINRDMYYSERDRYEREMQYRRLQEEEYRRMQNSYFNSAQQPQVMTQVPKPDLKDPLAFLTKTDNKILLTGEAT